MQISLNIIAPITTAIKEFHTPEVFNIYYQLHKEEIDGTITHKLNKLNKIEGYRITKIKHVLMLKRNIEKTAKDDDINVKDELCCGESYIHGPAAVLRPSLCEARVTPPSDICTIKYCCSYSF